MIKRITFIAAIFFCGTAAGNPADTPDDTYFANPELKLSEPEKAALAITKDWKADSDKATKPISGPDGSVRFIYGTSQPSIVCAVLQVCDIELQPGEQINSIHMGDAARWTVEPAITGDTGNEVQHLIVKPLDAGLTTSLIVTTNRRTYHMSLRSARGDYMPHVSFVYPDDAEKKWEAIKAAEHDDHEKKTIPETGEYLGNLDFNYRIDGDASWKPVRVYNDGHKTILEMPKAMSQSEAPTLLIIRRDGGAFSDDEQVMVNYRLQHDRYIVDSVFDKAILITGVGSSQDRVTITRGQ